MKRQGGFTLIEMIVVIVILGILAVTAAPKFLNFQDDARDAALEGLRGAINSASSMVYGKYLIAGESPSGEVDKVKVTNGYPSASTDGIGAAIEGVGQDWKEQTPGTATPGKIQYTFNNSQGGTRCVIYTQSTGSGVAPTSTVDTCL